MQIYLILGSLQRFLKHFLYFHWWNVATLLDVFACHFIEMSKLRCWSNHVYNFQFVLPHCKNIFLKNNFIPMPDYSIKRIYFEITKLTLFLDKYFWENIKKLNKIYFFESPVRLNMIFMIAPMIPAILKISIYPF